MPLNNSTLKVVMKFNKVYISDYANLTSNASVLFIANYKSFVSIQTVFILPKLLKSRLIFKDKLCFGTKCA